MSDLRFKLRGGHASGRFDVPVDEMAAYFLALVTVHRLHFLSTTETKGLRYRRRTRRELGKAFRVQGLGEHLFITRRDVATPIGRPRTLFVNAIRRLALWRQMRPVVFNHRIDGRRWRFLVVHGPAGIQNGSKWRSDRGAAGQVENARKGWARLGRNMRRFQRRHPDAIQVVLYDCNLDLGDPKWLRWMEDTLDAESIWRDRPTPATHAGGRTIDGAQHMGDDVETVGADVSDVPKPDGLDHGTPIFVLAV